MKKIYLSPSIIRLSFLFVALVFTVCNSNAQSSSQGPSNPTVVTEQNNGCLSCPGADWVNPMSAQFADNVFTTAALQSFPSCFQSSCYYSRGLMASSFGFAIPTGATITGIKAEVLRKASAISAVKDTAWLLSGINVTGTSHTSGIFWTMNPLYEVYGDSTDLWGRTWTDADINASGFGFFLKAFNLTPSATTTTASVDHVRVTVYYQTATGITEHQSSDDDFRIFFNRDEQRLTIKTIYTLPFSVELYNSLGEEVYKTNFHNNISSLDIRTGQLAEGIYVLNINTSQKRFSKKILIEK